MRTPRTSRAQHQASDPPGSLRDTYRSATFALLESARRVRRLADQLAGTKTFVASAAETDRVEAVVLLGDIGRVVQAAAAELAAALPVKAREPGARD